MSKENVEKLLLAGGSDKALRAKYNVIETKEKFVAAAEADGYVFSVQELDEFLDEEGLDFECSGNPRSRQVWLR
ncbi:Nif11-like leader peptide family natural product precursor [Pelagicoccus sp. SDUM812003]|uniref:Nif11-like leader peptide family natural product precursor n=1 Tax=Pelagicoccus sp. SDUM812003 TaxID=3041267 RepID=UPI00280D5D90|nr:Nif11-like leader peptide family natural product precursor [Pelagicoccus sp. SDUM812003]MDQ8202813.1 Nif11-like leader peptide family natural product precursor [Pelagicoccus sp. SDUM812003]